jgi:hypothetical protein
MEVATKLRRVVVALSLTLSTLLVGAVGYAWAGQDSTSTPSPTQSSGSSGDDSTSDDSADRTDRNCPNEESSGDSAEGSSTTAVTF